MTEKLAFQLKMLYICIVGRREKDRRRSMELQYNKREILVLLLYNSKTKLNYD